MTIFPGSCVTVGEGVTTVARAVCTRTIQTVQVCAEINTASLTAAGARATDGGGGLGGQGYGCQPTACQSRTTCSWLRSHATVGWVLRAYVSMLVTAYEYCTHIPNLKYDSEEKGKTKTPDLCIDPNAIHLWNAKYGMPKDIRQNTYNKEEIPPLSLIRSVITDPPVVDHLSDQ